MLTVRDYYHAINKIAPFEMAEAWDNVGLLIGDLGDRVNTVLLALDATTKVIDEAVDNKVDLLITHHPLMFNPIKRLSSTDLVYRLAENNIALITAHTNLDATQGGVNDVLAEKLELNRVRGLAETTSPSYYQLSVYVPASHCETVYQAILQSGGGAYDNYYGCVFISEGKGRFLPLEGSNPTIGNIDQLETVDEVKIEVPAVAKKDIDKVIDAIKKAHPYEKPSISFNFNYGLNTSYSLGRVGELKRPMTPKEFANFIKIKLDAAGVKYTSNKDEISTVALCSGSGGSFLEDAINRGADAYVTGELKHDLVLKATENGLSTFEAGHFATETIVMEALKNMLEIEVSNSEIILSKSCTDGIMIV